MEGGGIFSLLGGVVLLPFQLVADLLRLGRWLAQRRRLLSPHELNLQHASHPVGALVLLLAVWRLYGAQLDHARIAYAVDGRLLAAVAGAAFVFGLALFLAGMRHCSGLRDEVLMVRACGKLAIGAAACVYLWRATAWRIGGENWPDLLAAAVFLVALWCAVTGAVRLLLLTVSGGNALALIRKLLRRRNAPLRPARRRRGFWFW